MAPEKRWFKRVCAWLSDAPLRREMAKPDFNTLACDYAKYRTAYSQELFDQILDYARMPPNGRVLDLACGTGLGMLEYLRRGLQVCGVDVAPAMIEQARRSLPADSKVEFAIGSAEAIPAPAASFDLVSCAQAFHWFEPHSAFAECARVLKPGGALAAFWKHTSRDDALTRVCESIIGEWLGREAVARSRDHAAEHESGWPVFWEYVGPRGEPPGERIFFDGEKRLIEFTLPRTRADFVGYQRSREKIRTVLGARRADFLRELDARLRAQGAMNEAVTQRQIQYVFLARKRLA